MTNGLGPFAQVLDELMDRQASSARKDVEINEREAVLQEELNKLRGERDAAQASLAKSQVAADEQVSIRDSARGRVPRGMRTLCGHSGVQIQRRACVPWCLHA